MAMSFLLPLPGKHAWLLPILLPSLLLPLSLVGQPSLPQAPAPPAQPPVDWLLDATPYEAAAYRGTSPDELILSNGLIRRTFRLAPNGATVGFDQLTQGQALLRGVKPEAQITVNGVSYEVGGLKGQPNYAFLRPEWLDTLSTSAEAFQFAGYELSEPSAPFAWKRMRHHDQRLAWPPRGVHLRMDYEAPQTEAAPAARVAIHYELYDGLPVIGKWLEITNEGDRPFVLDQVTSELLAVVEYSSAVESREFQVRPPNLHVETDYAFSSFTARDANHHVVHWKPDPDYHSQVNYLKQTPCLLEVSPEIGPSQVLQAGDTFTSFRTFLLAYDSYERERNSLALRRMYRTLAPWSTENPLMMHARFADWERVKLAIDQAAEVGFEMVILTFGSGFKIEDDSEAYLQKMKGYADYAREKGVEIGGYSLLASRSISPLHDVRMPEGQSPTFGNSPCIGSEWGEAYFQKLYQFYEQTGFSLLEHDGSYPGDVCAARHHPGHAGLLDSRWNQYQVISKFYQWCRGRGIYLNVPDFYYLTGSNKCGMGYREVNWSLPRSQQLIHTRQNIYDGSWQKLSSMGWMFVPLTEYHGGGAAATIEPLNEHLDHYERMITSNLGGGVQACYRGPRLYDTEETRRMVTRWVDWYKAHRAVLEGDIIHLRRADGRDLDYWLNVNPKGEEKGLLAVFNPLSEPVNKTLYVPLYYTGLKKRARVRAEDGSSRRRELDAQGGLFLDVEVPAHGFRWWIFE